MSHGHSSRYNWTPTYYSWAAMVQRCVNPARNNYHNYGARGVSVCKRWLTFENFLADMGERPAGTSIDRINTDGDYELGNCAWCTRVEQNRNRRNNKLTMDRAMEIRAMHRAGCWSYVRLGELFDVSDTMIRNVVTEKAWA